MNSSDNTSAELTEIQELGNSMTDIVSGGNYVASFHCIELGNIHNLDNAVTAINKHYAKSQLQKEDVEESSDGWPATWKKIADSIWYGVDTNDGDHPNRPPLSQDEIAQLGQYRDSMKKLLGRLVDDKADIYTFGWVARIKGYINLDDYVVMWAYRFIIINPNGNAYLLHGSSSD